MELALNNLGITYRVTGKIDSSIQMHQKAASLDSLNTDSFNNLGLAYIAKGDIHSAIQSFERVLKIQPANAVAHNNLAYSYYEILNYSMAMQHAKAAERFGLKINPDFMKDLNKSLDPNYMRARYLVVKTEAEAQEILNEIKNGGDFAQIAAAKSLDKVTAASGGDFGYFKKGDLMPEFEKVIASLKKGEVSGIIKSNIGFQIFQKTK